MLRVCRLGGVIRCWSISKRWGWGGHGQQLLFGRSEKPDIRIYEKVANLLRVASSECIFVGDGGSKAGFLVAEAPLAILRAHV